MQRWIAPFTSLSSLAALGLVLALASGGAVHAQTATGSGESEPAGTAEQPATDPAPAAEPPVSNGPTAAEINEAIALIEQDSTLDEETKKTLLDSYRGALAALSNAEAAATRRVEAKRASEGAPGRLQAIRDALAKPSEPPRVDLPSNAPLAEIERGLAQAQAELQAARKEADELQAESTKRRDRRAEIPDQIAQLKRRLGEVETSIAGLDAAGEATPAQRAQRTLLRAQRKSVNAEIAALEAELESYDARQELLPARRDAAVRRVRESEQLVAEWQRVANSRRLFVARQDLLRGERLLARAEALDPALAEFAAESVELAAQRTGEDGILLKEQRANADTKRREEQLDRVRAQYQDIKRRIRVSGFNRTVGRQLRRQYESLPELADPSELRKRLNEIQPAIEDAEYRLYELQESRLESGDVEAATGELLGRVAEADAGGDGSGEGVDPAEEALARELVAYRRDILSAVIDDLRRYIDEGLEPQEAVLSDLREAATAYESFIRERILWVRSVSAEGTLSLDAFVDSGTWLADAGAWRTGFDQISADVSRRWPTTGFALLLLTGLFASAYFGRRRIRELKKLVARFSTDKMSYTFEAVLWTLLASIAWPALLWWAGWLLSKPIAQPGPVLAVGYGLQVSALLLLPLGFLLRMLKPGGLADAHFRWSQTAMRVVRRHLRWLTPMIVVTMALATGYDQHAPERLNGALGRVSFTIGLLSLAVALQRLLRPKGPVLGDFFRDNAGGWIDRLRYLWFPAVVGIPVALVAASWFGYHYTALQLQHRFESTLVLVLVVVVANGLMLRWLFLARRRVAVENARRRREQAQAEAAAEAAGESSEQMPPAEGVTVSDEHHLDLPAVSAQTRQLIRTGLAVTMVIGLFTIWASVLPALRMLDRVQIWPSIQVTDAENALVIPVLEPAAAEAAEAGERPAGPDAAATEVAQGESASSDGSSGGSSGMALPGMPSTGSGEESSPVGAVTLADLGLALVLLAATVVAFRNVPGLVEIVVLQRLPLDAGSRFALSTVLRYLIAMIGLLLAFGAMGIAWNNVQWLAAALTFGLAFGLQEIFANFVSGLIILAERPIRIGDTVTVNNISGTVTKIRMRATTITDWDRKELVIPNKTFITGEVVNWTLSDPSLRMSIPVGVAYGADIRKAEETLIRVAKANKTVMTEPAPFVVFNQFGDSTLNFELRVFIPSIEHLIAVKHALHMAITEAFREEKIEIAFPQRDLHIRSIGDLEGVIKAGQGSGTRGETDAGALEAQSH